MFDNIKKDFPIFSNNPELVYLDNAATSQKPQEVIDAVCDVYTKFNAPVHKGLYNLADIITSKYEQTREKIAQFINALPNEIVFTHGATDGLNIIANSFVKNILKLHKNKKNIVISALEHHSNLILWQQIAAIYSIELRIIDIDNLCNLNDIDTNLIDENTIIVSLAYYSNILGIKNNIEPFFAKAKAVGAYTALDAAQAVPRRKLDVKTLNTDFIVFSAHKMLGPTGVGALYIKSDLHEFITPVKFGGGMVTDVNYQNSIFAQMPAMLESGSSPAEAVIGFGAAIKYLEEKIDFSKLQEHEYLLSEKLCQELLNLKELYKKNINIIGNFSSDFKDRFIVSFTIDNIHAHDIAAYVDRYKICLRAGNHCAQPVHKKLGFSNGSVRASFYLYNNLQDVDILVKKLAECINYFL